MKMKQMLFVAVALLQVGYLLADDQVKNVSCKSVTARFKGVFRNEYDPDVVLAADFQLRLVANNVDRQIYRKIDYWNNDRINTSEIEVMVTGVTGGRSKWKPVFEVSTMPFLNSTNDGVAAFIAYYVDKRLQIFLLLEFPDFDNNTFRFNSTNGGGCTNKYEVEDDWAPDPKLFDFCLCCNDYAPDTSLNCPYKPDV